MIKIQVVTLFTVVVGYQHFRGPCYLNLQFEVNGNWESRYTNRKYKSILSQSGQVEILHSSRRRAWQYIKVAATGTNRPM